MKEVAKEDISNWERDNNARNHDSKYKSKLIAPGNDESTTKMALTDGKS
jgi:hypothetical protein